MCEAGKSRAQLMVCPVNQQHGTQPQKMVMNATLGGDILVGLDPAPTRYRRTEAFSSPLSATSHRETVHVLQP